MPFQLSFIPASEVSELLKANLPLRLSDKLNQPGYSLLYLRIDLLAYKVFESNYFLLAGGGMKDLLIQLPGVGQYVVEWKYELLHVDSWQPEKLLQAGWL